MADKVPAVPIYVGETIDTLAPIDELRAESEGRPIDGTPGAA